ncbi:bifunctional sugar-1-phosphate nucleotidylyltransferase/acetyltransferase [Halocatena marina]|uniref:Bifunctional protein GlmU n=1 Tax=Halocatena marina TaxID=2934937 RepID=A0ABD5YTQ0_9EURY|nr:bifunctional sugar-1-phosphate nucleotidylyltransferase/acetyltransferase [Halocatena marina]
MPTDTAVVLAAGEGTRLRPLTRNRPKPMLPAGNRPIVEYVLDALIEAGIKRICLVVGYKRSRVQEHFGAKYRDVPIQYVVQSKQLGSGHALQQAKNKLSGSFVVVNGDRVIEPSIVTDVLEASEEDDAATLAVLERPVESRYGAVVMRGSTIVELIEKPDDEYRLVNGGVYVFDERIFDALAETPRQNGSLLLTDAVDLLIYEATVRGVRTEGLWSDATYPWDLLSVSRALLEHELVDGPQHESGVWVADSAIVHDDATLQSPVVIGPDCELGPGAVIGPNVALGRNVTVGANSTVESSVIDTDTRIGAGSTLLDCVTGQDVDLGAGTVVPGGPADVQINESLFRDERLGAVFADRVRSGGGVRCKPGALVGTNARLGTGVVVDGHVPERAEVVR